MIGKQDSKQVKHSKWRSYSYRQYRIFMAASSELPTQQL